MATHMPGERATAGVVEACRKAVTADELLEWVSTEFHRLVPSDASMWLGMDPAMLLPTSPGRISGIDPVNCSSFWQRELQVQDSMLFRDLARSAEPTATLRQATGDQPARSARYRELMRPAGFDDELRAVLRSGDQVWGVLGLYRDRGRPAFESRDIMLVNAVSATVAAALRTHVASSTPWRPLPMTPGMLVFDAGLRLVSANAEARLWLEELGGFRTGASPADDGHLWPQAMAVPDPSDLIVPSSLSAVAAQARAVAAGRQWGPARLRLRGRNGRWLVVQASCLGVADGDQGAVTVVIEPANSAEIAPIIVECFGLSSREHDIVRGLAQGLSTAELATQLFLSPHTVRDYMKSVFEKVGVSSRGQLIAKLFAGHYYAPLRQAVVHGN